MKTRIARGFTLVEIAVVVAVLSIIATMTLVTYNRVQAEGRDTKRKNDIVILSSQLEKYYEKNGLYPMGCGGTTCTTGSFWYFPDTTNVISTSSTSAQLTTLLSRDMTNIYDPYLEQEVLPSSGHFTLSQVQPKGTYTEASMPFAQVNLSEERSISLTSPISRGQNHVHSL